MLSSEFNNFNEFLAMGGYGIYVWPVYLLALVVLGGQVIGALRAKARKSKNKINRPRVKQS